MAISKILSYLSVLICLIFSLAFSGNGWAQAADADFVEIRAFALKVEKQLRKNAPDNQTISESISTLTRYRSIAARCVQSSKVALGEKTNKIQAIENNLEELDPTLQQESERALKESKREQADATNRLVDCQLLEQRLGELITSLTDIQNQRLISEMQFREQHGVDTTLEIIRTPNEFLSQIYALAVDVIKRLSGLRAQLIQLIPVLLMGLIAALWIRSRLSIRIANFDDSIPKISFSEAFIRVSARYSMWAIPLLAISAFLIFKEYDQEGFSNLSQLVFVLTGYSLTLALISFLLAPREGYARILTLRRQVAAPMARSLRILVTLSTVGGIFYLFLHKQEISSEIINAARLFALTIFSINALIFLTMLARARLISPFSRLICYFISGLFLVALIAAWFGYQTSAILFCAVR